MSTKDPKTPPQTVHGPLNFDAFPASARELLRIDLELGGDRGLYDQSSFWRAGRNTVRNEEGFEVVQAGPCKVVVRSADGRDVTLKAEWWEEGTDDVVGIQFHAGLTWDDSDELVTPEDIWALIFLLGDALLAFEVKAKFLPDPALEFFVH